LRVRRASSPMEFVARNQKITQVHSLPEIDLGPEGVPQRAARLYVSSCRDGARGAERLIEATHPGVFPIRGQRTATSPVETTLVSSAR